MSGSRRLTGQQHACEQCGSAVYRSPAQSARVKHIFCSDVCKFAFRRGKKLPHWSRAGHPRWIGSKYCKTCGVELFDRQQRQTLNCRSESCLHAAKARNKSGSKNGRWLGGDYPNCKQCGKEIVSKDRLTRTFCSRKCVGQWQSKHLAGPNSPIWKGPGNRANETYSPEWSPRLRRQIRDRDNFSCQNCGKARHNVDIHHIDGDKWNCDPLNLICLCRSCHRYITGGSIPCPRPSQLIAVLA